MYFVAFELSSWTCTQLQRRQKVVRTTLNRRPGYVFATVLLRVKSVVLGLFLPLGRLRALSWFPIANYEPDRGM